MRHSLLTLVLFLVFVPSILTAQEALPQKMSLQGSFGTVTMDGVQWQRFSFRPDIPLGNFGVGLDLELFVDNEGKISDEGWDFSNKNKAVDSILRKLYYIRYGKSLDRFYGRAGALDDVMLGYGMVMDGYRNTLNYPSEKKIGLDFALRDIGTFGIGVHGMVNSFGDLKNNGVVTGARISAKPLKPTDMSLLSKLTFGVTFVRDVNQFAGLKDSDDDGYPDFQDGFDDDDTLWLDTDHDGITDYYTDKNGDRIDVDRDADGDGLTDPWYTGSIGAQTLDHDVETEDMINIEETVNGVSVFGFDVAQPLVEGLFHLDLYGQYAKIHTGEENWKGGWGTGAPGLLLRTERFRGQVEYRHFEGRFRPGYFDNLYEHERVTLIGNTVITKEMRLTSDNLNGVYGKLGYNFYELFFAEAGYQYMKGDNTYQDFTAVAQVLDTVLQAIPKISLLEAYFYNRFVDPDQYGLFEFSANTLYGTRIGFSLTPGMAVVWNTQYTFTPKPGGDGFEKNRFVSIETVVTMR